MNEIKSLVSLQYNKPTTREELIQIYNSHNKYKQLFINCTQAERRLLIIECEPNKDTPDNQAQLLSELKINKFDKKAKELIALQQSIIEKAEKLGIIANEKKSSISEEVKSNTSQR